MTSLWLDSIQPALSEGNASRTGPDRKADVVVIGAGITGLSTAVMLAEAGKSVIVLEARFPGAVATGNSTAKISLLQGSRLSSLARHHPAGLVKAYVDSNRDGRDWLVAFCRSNGVPIDTRTAYTYAATPNDRASVDREVAIGRAAGLDVRRVDDVSLPFDTFGAAALDGQFEVDPARLVRALVERLTTLGGRLVIGTATGVHAAPICTIESTVGPLRAAYVVDATGTPFLDRGLYFAKVKPQRSYALSFRMGAAALIDDGMYLSAESGQAPTRSLRTATVAGERYLIVGGNGHEVGRHPSPRVLVDDIVSWTRLHFPGSELTHSWSAQDYESHNLVPFVGKLPRGRGHIYFATGFAKWGMTNGPAAALRMSAEILGDTSGLPWVKVIGRRITTPADLARGAVEGATVARETLGGWVDAEKHPLDASSAPAEGVGIVGNIGRKPVALSTVDGVVCAVSAICPHLGGVVTWNDAERSWDCPLHGSRFSSDGTRLEGPATRGLARAARPDEVSG